MKENGCEELLKILLKCRDKKKISQEKIADELEITLSTYGRNERGKTKMSLETFVGAFAILGIDVAVILKEAVDDISSNKNKIATSIPPVIRRAYKSNPAFFENVAKSYLESHNWYIIIIQAFMQETLLIRAFMLLEMHSLNVTI